MSIPFDDSLFAYSSAIIGVDPRKVIYPETKVNQSHVFDHFFVFTKFTEFSENRSQRAFGSTQAVLTRTKLT